MDDSGLADSDKAYVCIGGKRSKNMGARVLCRPCFYEQQRAACLSLRSQ